ncbi:type 3 dihydrofolate reductase [Halorubrum gandharaense]
MTGEPDPSSPSRPPEPPEVPGDLTLALIAAVGENRVIGDDEGMPWHYPADLAHFKRTTTGHPLIMGRTTYESIIEAIGEPLPGRTSVVLSRSDLDLPEGAVHADDLQTAVDLAVADARERDVDTIYVAGGGTVYRAFLPVADRLVITEVPEFPEGDTTFPVYDEAEWTAVDREVSGELTFLTYDRRSTTET